MNLFSQQLSKSPNLCNAYEAHHKAYSFYYTVLNLIYLEYV
jgi:hypothetical protein